MPSETDLQIFLEIKIISMRMFKNFSSSLKEINVTPSEAIVILKIYYDKNNSVTPTSVAHFLNVARSRSSIIIDKLFEKKLINLEENPTDRRCRKLSLSVEGKILAKKIFKLLEQEIDTHFNFLDDVQKATLLEIIKKANSLSR